MMRASVAAEKAGVPSVSLVATGFLRQAEAIARALGAESLGIAEYPGVPLTDSAAELREKVEGTIIEEVVRGLTTAAKASAKLVEPEATDIVFKGTLREVQERFHRNLWSDGMPIIPPTIEEVERFLGFTDRAPDQVTGVLLPENRQATVWNVAVNGVMAGCRPEYMPVLLAAVEAIADPEFRVEDAGSTPGWEPLIVLNGPIIKELDFNFGAGVMRVGRQANTSVGRFLRLYMRNVAGLRIPPGATDKGSIAQSFNVALAENEDAVAEFGWQPFSVDRGFQAGDNVVTVLSSVGPTLPTYTAGNTALDHLKTLADLWGRALVSWSLGWIAEARGYPLFVLGPAVAKVIARDGFSKDDIRRYLYNNVTTTASYVEKLAIERGTNFTFRDYVQRGVISREYCQSDDPDRRVPIFTQPEWIGIVVSGDPGRNQSKGYVQNHKQGVPVSKRISLPRSWNELRERQERLAD
ncbi:MAG: hypothetical protein HYX92_22255 [Chloroflexi bacterium]|nr:hypothetical protein [Chloroflexota bacterium]